MTHSLKTTRMALLAGKASINPKTETKSMKKYFFMAVAGMLALSSCSNDNDPIIENNGPHAMTFTAGYADVTNTRASMDFETKKVSFDANDKISILGTNNANCQFTTSAGGASAAFSGEATNDSKYYAVYPYTAGLTLDGTTIHGVTIPTTQVNSKWKEEESYGDIWGWDPKAPVALAVADPGQALQFKNLCAILKVKLNDSYSYFSVVVSANEALSGTFDLNTADGTLTATTGSTQVTTGDAQNIVTYGNRHIYLAIKPGTYTNFHLSVNFIDGFALTSKTKNNVTFEAGKIYDLGTN